MNIITENIKAELVKYLSNKKYDNIRTIFENVLNDYEYATQLFVNDNVILLYLQLDTDLYFQYSLSHHFLDVGKNNANKESLLTLNHIHELDTSALTLLMRITKWMVAYHG